MSSSVASELIAEIAHGLEQDVAPEFPEFRLEVKRFVLLALLDKAASVIPSREIVPVLKNFQFTVTPSSLRVVATDLELAVISETSLVAANTSAVGMLPAAKMLEIVRECADGDVVLDVANGVATIQAGSAQWTLRTPQGDDYPELPDLSEVTFHTVERVPFLGGVQAVRYAASTDTVRPSLMMIDVSNARFTACDGVRFQQARLGQDLPLSIQLPIGAVDDLVKLLRSSDADDIRVGEADHHLVFRVGTDVFIASKLMVDFPDVEALLLQPALENTEHLVCDRQNLMDAVKRARINADSETSTMVLRLTNNTITVTTRDKFGNACQDHIVASWGDAPRDVVVNHKYLTDMLGMYSARLCHFWFGPDTKTKKSPVLLKDPETETVGLIQQMRAEWLVD